MRGTGYPTSYLNVCNHSSVHTYDAYFIFESCVRMIRVILCYLSYIMKRETVKHRLPFLDSIKYSLK